MENEPQNQCDPSPGANPPVQLHAKPYKVNGTIEWGLGFGKDPAPGSRQEVDLPNRSGEHRIVVHLVCGPTGVKFDIKDPIWVCDTGTCPPPEGSKSAQIAVCDCTDFKLTLIDKNKGDPCVLTYQLNFIGAKPLDPMIRNGGSV